MASIERTYIDWKVSIKSPDGSIFYYHRDLDRIMLSLAIFVITSKPLVGKLGKAEMLQILHLQVPELINYWFDENADGFESLFPLVMTISDAFCLTANEAERQFPSHKRAIRMLACLFAHSVGLGGDMSPKLAEECLDDLTTDMRQLHSDKIKAIGDRLFFLTQRYGIDIPFFELCNLGDI